MLRPPQGVDAGKILLDCKYTHIYIYIWIYIYIYIGGAIHCNDLLPLQKLRGVKIIENSARQWGGCSGFAVDLAKNQQELSESIDLHEITTPTAIRASTGHRRTVL